MAKLNEVFGIRSNLVLSYVDREKVDDRFELALEGDNHIVVYGSSKQGKTSLRQTYVPDDQCVIVRCSPRMDIGAIYSSILRQTHVRIETIHTDTTDVNGKVTGKLGFKAFIPWVGGGESEVGTGGLKSETQLKGESN